MLFGIIIFVVFSCLFYYLIYKFIENRNDVILDLNNSRDINLLSYATTNILFKHIRTFQLIEDIYNSRLIFTKYISYVSAIETIKRDFNINSYNLYDLNEIYDNDMYLKIYNSINNFYEYQHIIKCDLKYRINNRELIMKDLKKLIFNELCDYYDRFIYEDIINIKYFLEESIKEFDKCEDDIYIEYEKMKNHY